MQDVTRRRSIRLGILIASALAAVALVFPPLCAGAFGKDRPDKAEETKDAKEAKDKEAVKPDEEKPGDFWIDLKKKEGGDLERSIDAAIQEIFKRMEALEKRMDEMGRAAPDMRRMPARPGMPDLREFQWRWQRPELQALLRQLDRELPRGWPPDAQELLKQLEREWPNGVQGWFQLKPGEEPFGFDLKLGPGQTPLALRMDMQETDDAYVIKVDMPGMDKENIVVEVTDNVLKISGERKERVEENKEGKEVRREITYGSFEREMTLPSDADTAKITSKYDNGVLVITVPKKEGQADKSKRIIVHQP
jgi:HSP20 family protein